MLNHQLTSAHVIPLKPSQTAAEALAAMHDLEVHQLPVVEEGIFKGMFSEEDLMEEDQQKSLTDLDYMLLPFSVKKEDHIINAVKLSANHRLDVIPVVDEEKHYLGSIDLNDLMRQYAKISGAEDMGGLIVLEIDKIQYSSGEISRLVETNDAVITQLNTYVDDVTGKMTITLRINKIEVSDIVATFQRYEYHVIYFFGKEEYENELQHNFYHLMNYLDI